MHKGFIVLAALVWTAAAAVQAQELQNGSFEDPETAAENPWGDLAAHWGRWGSWMNRETGWTPTRSGTCIIGYHHWEITDNDTSGLYQDVQGVAAGKLATFSVYAMKDEGSNIESFELRLEPLNGGEAVGSRIYSAGEIGTASWSKLSVDGKTVGDGVRVLVIIKPKQGGDRSGAVKIEDAELLLE